MKFQGNVSRVEERASRHDRGLVFSRLVSRFLAVSRAKRKLTRLRREDARPDRTNGSFTFYSDAKLRRQVDVRYITFGYNP